jgi:hypothetical protein
MSWLVDMEKKLGGDGSHRAIMGTQRGFATCVHVYASNS